MDALDARILRELGVEPFVGWQHRPRGLRTVDVARSLGVGVQLVKDRIARMSADGVIVGYRIFPNLRHFGLDLSTFHVQSGTVPDAARLSRLRAVDGFVNVVWFFDSGLCFNLAHASDAERTRRLQLLSELLEGDDTPAARTTGILPPVDRPLSPLDVRIIQVMAADAKRPVGEVADELGVTPKTVRTRLAAMRDHGSIDEIVALDFTKMRGLIPFELATWFEPGADPRDALIRHFRDRLFAHFEPPENGFCSLILRVFAYTPPEVQMLVREALDVPGVERAAPLVATGGFENEGFLAELLSTHVAGEPVRSGAPRLRNAP